MAALLKENSTVACPVHIVPLNSLINYRQYLIYRSHIFAGFLPVPTAEQELHSKIHYVVEWGSIYGSNCIVSLADKMPQDLRSSGNNVKVATLHKSMQNKLHCMIASMETRVKVIICGKVCKFHQVITTY